MLIVTIALKKSWETFINKIIMKSTGLRINLDEGLTIFSLGKNKINLLIRNSDNYIIVSRETSQERKIEYIYSGINNLDHTIIEDAIENYTCLHFGLVGGLKIRIKLTHLHENIEDALYYSIIIGLHKLLKVEYNIEKIPLPQLQERNGLKELYLKGGLRITIEGALDKRLPLPIGTCILLIQNNNSYTPKTDMSHDILKLIIGLFTFDMELIKTMQTKTLWEEIIKTNIIEIDFLQIKNEILFTASCSKYSIAFFQNKYTRDELYNTLIQKNIKVSRPEINLEGLSVE